MQFPLVPLPGFLATKEAVQLHQETGGVIFVAMAFFGMLVLFLVGCNVLGRKPTDDDRGWAASGLFFLGVAVLGAVFGLYLGAVIFGALALFLLYSLIKGFQLVLGKA